MYGQESLKSEGIKKKKVFEKEEKNVEMNQETEKKKKVLIKYMYGRKMLKKKVCE